MYLQLKTWVPKSSERLADTPVALAAMFDRADWFDDDGPRAPSLELHGRYEVASTLDRHAFLNYLDLTNQGTGGKMAQTLFVKRRSEAREAYTARIRECPELAFVDWSNAEIGGPTGLCSAAGRPAHGSGVFEGQSMRVFSGRSLDLLRALQRIQEGRGALGDGPQRVQRVGHVSRPRCRCARGGPVQGPAGEQAHQLGGRRAGDAAAARLRSRRACVSGGTVGDAGSFVVKSNGGRARHSSRRCDDRRARGLAAAGAAHGRHRVDGGPVAVQSRASQPVSRDSLHRGRVWSGTRQL